MSGITGLRSSSTLAVDHEPVVGKRLSRGEWVWLAIALLAVLAFQTAYISGAYLHKDEVIAWKVVDHMRVDGTLDTNWRFADLPNEFRYDQYNFSSYLLSSRFMVEVALLPARLGILPRDHRSTLIGLRACSAWLGTLTCLLVFLTVLRVTDSVGLAFFALTMGAVAPIMVQASHLARPEAFASFLSVAITLFLLTGRSRLLVAALFLSGVLIACKVSAVFVTVPPIVCLFLSSWRLRSWRLWLSGFLASLIGLVLGMPHALLNLSGYLSGIAALRKQYASHILPWSNVGADDQFARSLGYLMDTQGVVFLLLVICGFLWLCHRRSWLKLLVVGFPLVSTWLFFCFQPMFFERNLAHVFPHAIVLAAVGLGWIRDVTPKVLPWKASGNLLSVALGVVLVYVPAAISTTFVFQVLSGAENERIGRYEEELSREFRQVRGNITEYWLFSELVVGKLESKMAKGPSPRILKFPDVNDGRNLGIEQAQQVLDLKRVGRFSSVLDHVPKNGIRLFHSRSFEYFLYDRGAMGDPSTGEEP